MDLNFLGLDMNGFENNNDKPREKALMFGIDTLSTSELIAILLCTGSKNKDVIQLSNELLNHAGGIANLSKYSIPELMKFNGIKKAKALKIKAALEIHRRIELDLISKNNLIDNIDVACRIIKSLIVDFNQENFVVLLLDKQNKLITSKILTKGNEMSVSFSPSLILSLALKVFAKKIIIAHNHPSNNIVPSSQDIMTTDNLLLALSIVGVDLLDHLIIGDNAYYSIVDKTEYYYT